MYGEWRVETGTDYVPVILFITVGAHTVCGRQHDLYTSLTVWEPLPMCLNGLNGTSFHALFLWINVKKNNIKISLTKGVTSKYTC